MKKLRLLFILLFIFAFTSCGASEIEKKFQNDHSAYLQRAAEFKEIVSTINLSVELYENEKRIESEEVDMLIKLEQDPLYMEIYSDAASQDNLEVYYTDVTNRVFKQTVTKGVFGEAKYQSSSNEFDQGSTGNMAPSTAINFSHVVTVLTDGKYTLTGNAYYMFSKDYLEQISNMYGYSKDDVDSLKAIKVDLTIEFLMNSMNMGYVMSANVLDLEENKIYELVVTMDYKEEERNFDRYKSNPSSGGSSGGTTVTDKFSSASYVSVGQTMKLNTTKTMYFTGLKEGVYAFEYIPKDEDVSNHFRLAEKYRYVSYTIYDSKKSKVSNFNFGLDCNSSYQEFILIIDKAGTYFIEGLSNDNLDFKLIKLDYSDTFRDKNIVEYDVEMKGTTEGFFSIKKYVINSDVDGIVRITNTGDKLTLLTTSSIYEKFTDKINVPDYIDKYIHKGENAFYVVSPDTDIYYDRDYSFTVSSLYEYDADEYKVEYENLPVLTDTPAEKDYYGLLLFNPICFQFEVTETGDYVIKDIGSYDGIELLVTNEITHEIISGKMVDYEMVYSLDPGKYKVSIKCTYTGNYRILHPYYIKK